MPIQSFQPPVALSQLQGQPQSSQRIATPTVTNLYEDPGYQFRLGQGAEAIQRAGAARGMLGSGSTLAGLAEFGQGLASQEYGNAFQRAVQQGQFAQSEQARGFGERMGQAQFGAGEQSRGFGERLQARQMQEGLTQGQFGRQLTLENLQEALRQGQYNRQMGLADIGMRALGFSPGAPQLPASQVHPADLRGYASIIGGAGGSIAGAGTAMGSGQYGAGQEWKQVANELGQVYGRNQANLPSWLGGGGGGTQYTPTFGGQGFGSANLGGGTFNFGIGG